MGAVLLLLFITAIPVAQADGAPAPGSATLTKTCTPVGGASYTPAGSVPPGTKLLCQVSITLGPGSYSTLTVTDVVSGGGHFTDTLFGGGTLQSDQLNRQVYHLLSISAPTICPPKCSVPILTTIIAPTTLGCYRSITNGVYLDEAGVNGHLAVASDNFSVNCHAVPA